GVSIRDLDPAQAAQLGLNVSSGALVLQVVPGSPADQAGIPQNSVITRIDSSSVTDVKSLGTALQGHKPGQKVQVTWSTQSGSHNASVTLASNPTIP
ncbi:MAG: PDZ domain-containing protein, partial [Candidatus Dormibacteraeota bacterium]|nr:PDZ domain-containing protein [Candidatus Dormibacteraeota bacterium]